MKSKFILTAILSASYSLLMAQGNNFTLQQCVDYAMINSSKIQNAVLDEQLAAEKVKEIKGIGLPQAKLSHTVVDNTAIQQAFLPSSAFSGGTAGLLELLKAGSDPVLKGGAEQALAEFAKNPDIVPVGFGVKYNLITQASVTQLIFDGSYLVGLQAAKTYKDLAIKSTQMNKLDVIQNVHKAYYMVLVNAERKKIFTNNISRLDTIFRQTKALNQAGFVEKIEVTRLEVTFNNLLVEKMKFDNLYDLSVELLKFQIGMPSSEALAVSQKITDFQVAQLSGDPQVSFGNRPEYGLLQTQKALYELDLKNQKFARLPSVAAFGNFGFNNGSNKFDVYTTKNYEFSNIGLAINMPLFDGFQKYRKGQQAKLNIQKTNNSIVALEKGIAIQSKVAQIQLKNSIETLNNQRSNVTLAEEVARVSKEKYSKGVGSSLEVTNAESELKTAQINYFESLYNSLINKVELDAALGTLK